MTNGVTPRRFIVVSNPRLAALLTEVCGGEDWARDLSKLECLEAHADDPAFHERWRKIKQASKEDLANWLGRHVGVTPDPSSMFDVQAKRIHEYKRQHLNLLLSMNGALTIGTLDGANVEIREAVGDENFFLFGLTAEQAQRIQWESYRPWGYCEESLELSSALQLIESGLFSHGDKELFRPLTQNLLRHDPFMVMADYEHYRSRQSEVGHAWCDRKHWSRMSILNVARMGYFSSDGSVRDYCDSTWKVQPTPAAV